MNRSAVIRASLLLSSLLLSTVTPEVYAGKDKDASASKPTAVKKGPPPKTSKKVALDHSGRVHKGKASFYSHRFYGKTMADGTKMNPNSNVAASRTLPLGTKAEVTNLDNGKSEVVEIKDRGPYVDGRIIDLSPKTANKLDIKEQGVAPVAVTPIEVPQPDGTTKSVNNSSGN